MPQFLGKVRTDGVSQLSIITANVGYKQLAHRGNGSFVLTVPTVSVQGHLASCLKPTEPQTHTAVLLHSLLLS